MFPLFLLLPVALGVGIGLYFALPVEPPPWLGLGVAVAIAPLVWGCRRWQGVYRALLLLCCAVLGFGLAAWRSASAAAPVLAREGIYDVRGAVVEVEPLGRAMRLVVEPHEVGRLEEVPARVRVHVRQYTPLIEAGDVVEFSAQLYPPSPPLFPDGFDFARHAWFQRLGAVGYALNAPRILASVPQEGVMVRVNAARRAVVEALAHHDAATAPVAAAMLVGEQGGIREKDFELLRATGLVHLLSISGAHIGMVAWVVFLLVRRGMACSQRLALRWHLKKIAAVVALVAVSAYTVMAGMPVSAQRAWVMAALVLLAVMSDRMAEPMRLVTLAALMILLAAPESLLSAGFQMSFAATVALVAFYRWAAARREGTEGGVPLWQRPWRYVAGIVLSSLVATAATLPFGLYHFHQFGLSGLAANVAAIPLTAFVVLPFGLIGMLLLPLGLEGIAWPVMGWGIDGMMRVAEWVYGQVPLFWQEYGLPLWALVAAVAGGLWLCLGVGAGRWRWAGGGVAAAATLLGVWLNPVPEALVEKEYTALRQEDGWVLLGPGKGNFTTGVWEEALGVAGFVIAKRDGVERKGPHPGPLPKGEGVRCDAAGCRFLLAGRWVEVLDRADGVAEACTQSDTVITRMPVAGSCALEVPERGALAFVRGRWEGSDDWQGERLWSGEND